jgi:hypothetical protein
MDDIVISYQERISKEAVAKARKLTSGKEAFQVYET